MRSMRTVEANLNIPLDWLVEQLAERMPVDRHRAMVERLGEACTKTTAAHEISCSTQTVTAMIRDGRLLSACQGTRVDVRSIADYIERKPQKRLN